MSLIASVAANLLSKSVRIARALLISICCFWLSPFNTTNAVAAPPPQSSDGDSLLEPDGRIVFTTTTDFQVGTLVNVSASVVPDQLQLLFPPAETQARIPFIWIANSGEGTISKFDTSTGKELARYRTGAESRATLLSPSRTVLDTEGNVWVANRAFGTTGSVVRVLNSSFIDRNGNGVMDTSRDVNGDGRITGFEMLPWDGNRDGQPDDERIALVISVGRDRENLGTILADSIPRAVGLDGNTNLWVGLWGLNQYEIYSGQTGAFLGLVPTPSTPNGCVIDRDGQLWSVTLESGLDRFDTLTRTFVETIPIGGCYGITTDPDGIIWIAQWTARNLLRYDPKTRALNRYRVPANENELRGVAIDTNRNVWVSSTTHNRLLKFVFDETHTNLISQTTVVVGSGPTAAITDADGYIWTTTLNDDRAWKIDPVNNVVVTNIPTGDYPYNYNTAAAGVSRQGVVTGTWTEIIDSQKSDIPWTVIEAGTEAPAGTAVIIKIRTSNDRNALAGTGYRAVVSGQQLTDVLGRFLQVELTLTSATNVSPIVTDLTISTASLPSITIYEPVDRSEFPSDTPVVISGRATPGNAPGAAANTIALVTVNGRPVDSLDAAGNFFAKAVVRSGLNGFTFTATDALGQTAIANLTLFGVEPSLARIDFENLSEVSASLTGEYGRTSFNEKTRTLFADLRMRNTGQYPIDAPLLVGIRNLSDPTVRVLNSDGTTPDDVPFYDFSTLLPSLGGVGQDEGRRLPPGEASLFHTISFSNPNRIQFTYDLVVLGQLNRAPVITSVPVIEIIAGQPYAYDADATDPDNDPLTFSLTHFPSSMAINPTNGLVTWTPTNSDLGTHSITLRASDGRSGSAEQHYLLSVIAPPSNRPPFFTTSPLVVAYMNQPYAYDANALDPDDDPLTFSLLRGPFGMSVNGSNGIVVWSPQATTQVESIVDTLGDEDFFGFGSGRIGDPVPRIEFDNREADDPPFTDHDARFGMVFRPQGSNDLHWIHDVSRMLLGRTLVSATLELAIGGIQDGAPYSTGIDDRLFLNGIESLQAFDAVVQDAPGEVGGGRGTDMLRFSLDSAQLRSVVATGILDVFLQGGFENYTGLFYNDSYYIDFARLRLEVRTPSITNENYPVELVVSDGRGGSAMQSYIITVLPDPANHSPIIISQPVTNGTVEVPYSYPVVAFDPDNDSLTYSIVDGPEGASINPTNGLLTWMPQGSAHQSIWQFGTSGYDEVASIAVDSEHNLFAVVVFGGTVDFDPGPATTFLTSTGSTDTAVLKFQPDGKLVWARRMGGANRDNVYQIATDKDGNAYVTGVFESGNADFGSFHLASQGAYDAFVTKLDAQGSFQWAKSFGTAAEDQGMRVSIGHDGNVYVAGQYDGRSGIVVKLRSNGDAVWTNTFKGTGITWCGGLALDSSGNLYVAGRFAGRTDFDPNPFVQYELTSTRTAPGDYDSFLLKLDTEGNFVWARQFGGFTELSLWFPTMTIDGEGNLFIADTMDGTADLDPSPTSSQMFTSEGRSDTFVIKLQPTGDLIWARKLGGEGTSYTLGISHDPQGGIFVNGQFRETIDLDPGDGVYPITATNTSHGFLVKLDSNGNFQWPYLVRGDGALVGDRGFDYVRESVLDGRGGLFIAGAYFGTNRFDSIFGSITLTNAGERDGFITRLQFPATGTFPVTVRVEDGRGGFDTQSFSINVGTQPLLGEIRGTVFNDVNGDGMREFGDLFIASHHNLTDTDHGEILRFDGASGRFKTNFIDGLEFPHGVAFGPDGSLYVGDHSDKIWRFDATTGQPAREFASGGGMRGPQAIVFGPDGNLYVSGFLNNGVVRYSGTTGAFIDVFASGGGLNGPIGLTFGPDGNLYVVSVNNDSVIRYNGTSGAFIDAFIPPGRGGLSNAFDLAFNPNGDLYVSSPGKGSILRYNGATGAFMGVFIGPTSGDSAIGPGMAFGPDCNLYVATQDDRILRYDSTSGAFLGEFVTNGSGGLSLPHHFRFSPQSEGVLSRWVIYLDQNRNGRRDLGEPITTTDGCGNYAFANLAPGDYRVAQELPTGWIHTVPDAGFHSITLTNGETVTGIVFGNQQSIAPQTNRSPVFVTVAPTNATVAQIFRYEARATDLDLDPISYDLAVAPAGMIVQRSSGVVAWIPQPSQVGLHSVVLRAGDGRGGIAIQSFQVRVRDRNHSPEITSRPNGLAIVGQPWQYQVTAQDADEDVLTFGLGDHPPNMLIDSVSGLVTWTPTAAEARIHHIAVTVSDGHDTTIQFFDLSVAPIATNRPPQIATLPSGFVRLGDTYTYLLQASDPDGDPLTFILSNAPPSMVLTSAPIPSATARLLTWTPRNTDARSNFVALRVEDGRGGVARLEYPLFVVTHATNRPPGIVSTPPFAALVGTSYAYDARAVDPDLDLLVWELGTGPAGMSIDPILGTIRWIPGNNQLGAHRVIVRVSDAQGGFATQTYDVVVRAANSPPQIVSVPPARAATNTLFLYAVGAFDPDGDRLAFSLGASSPTNMAINATNGLVAWTPTASQFGTNSVVIRVEDGRGGVGEQSFVVTVSGSAENRYPVITSSPTGIANVGSIYLYRITAVDPDGDALTFQLLGGPPGMTVNTNTGFVQWTPNASQIGQHPVTVGAIDPDGAGGSQSFTILVVSDNSPPTITSQPVQSIPAGQLYRYDVRATDPDGDILTFSLTGPPGMTIDNLGRVTWRPTAANAGIHRVSVTAADPLGAFIRQDYDMQVIVDTTPPFIRIGKNQTNFFVGDILDVPLVATDSGGQVTVEVFFAGQPQPIGANQQVTLHLNQVGSFMLLARATDAAGNTASDSVVLNVRQRVIDPEYPVVQLTFPTDGAIITSLTNVLGTAKDANLDYYTLAVSLRGTNDFKEIWRGTTSVESNILGRLDPSTFANDSYTLRLTAVDLARNAIYIDADFEVTGELKIGNFRLSFVDLSIPVNGIPITVARTYDTLDAARPGDFGYGWRLEFRDARLRTSVGKRPAEYQDLLDEFEELFAIRAYSYPAFQDGTRIYVTPPGGRREAFTFKVQLAGLVGSQVGWYRFSLVPDPGVTSRLSIPGAAGQTLQFDAAGELFWLQGLRNFNPEDPGLGGRYELTTKEGIGYTIDAATGFITSVVDANANELAFSNNGITNVATGVGIAFTRDPKGRITSVADLSGRTIQYRYNANDDLVAVIDRETNTTQFVYSPQRAHFLEQVIDPLGRTGVRTEYDEQGRLKTLTDAAGNAVTLVHDPDASTEQVIDALGNTNTFVYDGRGNVIVEKNALGAITRRAYDANNNMTVEVDPVGRTNLFLYDGDGNVLRQTNALGDVTINTYQEIRPQGFFARLRDPRSSWRLASTTDPLGNTSQSEYDRSGNLEVSKDAAGNITRYTSDDVGNQTSIVDALGNTNRFAYDGSGRLTQQTDALSNVTTFGYDANGNQIQQITRIDGRFVTNSTAYDANGRPNAVTDALGNTTRTFYDAAGNTTNTVDALGRSTRFFYNERGQLTNTVFADGTSTSLAYDAAGRRTHTTDRAGRITQFYYDAVGRLTNTIYPDLTSTSTEYDLAGRVVTQIDPRGNRTEFRYEETCCQATVVRNALGREIRSINDAAGRKISEIDPLGRITRFAYDELGRRTNTFLADGTNRRTVYDVIGRVIAEVDQAGVTNRFEYDTLGRLTNVVDALGNSTSYTYNEAGNLLTQRDTLGRITRYEYDSLGRRIATILPLGQRATNLFNAVGNLVAATDFNTNTIRFDYDDNNRLRAKRFPDGTAVTYGYTLSGRRSAITNALGVFRFAYDSRDRLLTRTNWDGRVISYTYDPAGNVTSVTTPSQVVSNTHDALNRLLTVAEGANPPATYTYDDANNVVLMTLPNGTFRTNTYDALNRVTNIAHHGPGGVFASFGYTLGPTGQRLGVRELSTFNAQLSTVQRRWSYDPLQRLTHEELSGDLNLTNDYVMDAVGNRLYRTNTFEGVTAYAYDANDQLLTETLFELSNPGSQIVTRYGYDANGNTLSRSNANESVRYGWNFENRLTGAVITTNAQPPTTLNYWYDDDGIRIAGTVNGAETRYLIDANRAYAQVMEEYTSGGAVNAAYVYGQHPPISQNRSGSRSFFHGDHLNTTHALTSSGASPTDRYHVDAYGRVLVQSGLTQNPHLFAGEQRDRNLSLDYLRVRYLNFNAGRFYARDPFDGRVERPVSTLDYLYAEANPISNRDPSGTITLVEVLQTVAIVGILTSVAQNTYGELASISHGYTEWKGQIALLTASFDIQKNAKWASVFLGAGLSAGDPGFGVFIFEKVCPPNEPGCHVTYGQGVIFGASWGFGSNFALTESEFKARTPKILRESPALFSGGFNTFEAGIAIGKFSKGWGIGFRSGFATGEYTNPTWMNFGYGIGGLSGFAFAWKL